MREDFSELRQIVTELAQAQRRTEQHIEALVEAQRRTEQRLEHLEAVVETLVEQVRILTQAQQRTADTVGSLKGRILEWAYRDKAVAYFGCLLRRTRVVAFETIEQRLESRLSAEEFGDIVLLDLLVHGQPRQHSEIPEVWFAVEVSAVVDEGDVTRARRRTALLRQAGYRAIPVVAGEQTTLGAEAEARLHKVVILQNGHSLLWDEALAAWAREPGQPC
jgi:hypothetical protein